MKFNIKQHKYKVTQNKQVRTVDGIIFDSVKEARYYSELKIRRDAIGGDVLFFLRQAPFQIGLEKYFVDFIIFYRDGNIEFVDVKGYRTSTYKRKKRFTSIEIIEYWGKLGS